MNTSLFTWRLVVMFVMLIKLVLCLRCVYVYYIHITYIMYVFISCINPKIQWVRESAKNGDYSVDIRCRFSPELAHRKTRIPLFLLRITPMLIYFHPIYFHSTRSHPRLRLSSIRLLSSLQLVQVGNEFGLSFLFHLAFLSHRRFPIVLVWIIEHFFFAISKNL